MENEIWVKVNGIGNYEISNLGRFRNASSGLILKPQKLRLGYMQVNASHNYERQHYLLHRLIAIAFIENPQNKPFVNHINGVKHDNRIENLEWVTASENIQHSHKMGLSYNSQKQRKSASLVGRINGIKSCGIKVIDPSTGITYHSKNEMAKTIEVDYSTINRRIKNGTYKLYK
jgi:hypothetical protein